MIETGRRASALVARDDPRFPKLDETHPENRAVTMTTFDDAVEAMSRAPIGDSLSRPFLDLFPVSGVSIATVGPVLGSETLTATDDTALRLDELQFDLGEGPCWDAMRSGSPVLVSDARASSSAVWPTFGPAIVDLDVQAMFVFPVRVGPLQLGAIDLYSDRPDEMPGEAVVRAQILARAVSRAVLRHTLERERRDNNLEVEPVGAHSRRIVHQATGRILVQARVSADDAHLLLQGYAFSTGARVIDVATDILRGRLTFSASEHGIEEHRNE